MPKNQKRVIASSFPLFHFGSDCFQFVHKFKYLGHWIVEANNDNADTQREISNMFSRFNTLLRKFAKCTISVKTLLFSSFCICLYDASLWSHFNIGILNRLRACYIKCIKTFFGYKRRDSTTSMLCTLGLPSFDTLLINASTIFQRQWSLCNNSLVRHLFTLHI